MNIIDSDLQFIEADITALFGTTNVFTWDGMDYPCIPDNDETITQHVERGGYSTDRVLTLNVRKSAFADGVFITSNQFITYRNMGFKVVNVKEDPSNTMLILVCVGDTQGS